MIFSPVFHKARQPLRSLPNMNMIFHLYTKYLLTSPLYIGYNDSVYVQRQNALCNFVNPLCSICRGCRQS